MTKKAGADPGLPHEGGRRHQMFSDGGPVPPVASDWANSAFEIPGWRVLASDEDPMPGDVAAMENASRGYTGHVAIVTGKNSTMGTSSRHGGRIKETDWGFRENQQGKIVFRRWEGVDE